MFLAKIGARVMNACLARALSRTFPRFLILMITPSVRTYSLRSYSFFYVNLLTGGDHHLLMIREDIPPLFNGRFTGR